MRTKWGWVRGASRRACHVGPYEHLLHVLVASWGRQFSRKARRVGGRKTAPEKYALPTTTPRHRLRASLHVGCSIVVLVFKCASPAFLAEKCPWDLLTQQQAADSFNKFKLKFKKFCLCGACPFTYQYCSSNSKLKILSTFLYTMHYIGSYMLYTTCVLLLSIKVRLVNLQETL